MNCPKCQCSTIVVHANHKPYHYCRSCKVAAEDYVVAPKLISVNEYSLVTGSTNSIDYSGKFIRIIPEDYL